MIEIDFDGDDFAEWADDFAAELEINVPQAFRNGLDAVVARAKELAPVGQKRTPDGPTGLLKNSIQRVGPTGSVASGTLEGAVEAGAPYAAAVEYGTKPHEIRPRFRRALRWPVQGGFGFAKKVQHPGTRAQPFLGPALEQKADEVVAELEAAVELSALRADRK